jgi:hypothetical protein
MMTLKKQNEQRKLDQEELLAEAVGLDKYSLRWLQCRGLLIEDGNGLYDPRWVEVWREAKHYERVGFTLYGALCQAHYDVFGTHPTVRLWW